MVVRLFYSKVYKGIFKQKVKQHPDKTFIGRVEKGFNFLGYHFSREALQLANITVRRHVDRMNQLYEQQKVKQVTSHEMTLILGEYSKRWQRWCTAGLSGITQQIESDDCFYEINLVRQGVLGP